MQIQKIEYLTYKIIKINEFDENKLFLKLINNNNL